MFGVTGVNGLVMPFHVVGVFYWQSLLGSLDIARLGKAVSRMWLERVGGGS